MLKRDQAAGHNIIAEMLQNLGKTILRGNNTVEFSKKINFYCFKRSFESSRISEKSLACKKS